MMTTGLIPRVYPLLVECVERGVAHGVRRVAEFTTNIDGSEAREMLAEEILNAICEGFSIEQDGEDELA